MCSETANCSAAEALENTDLAVAVAVAVAMAVIAAGFATAVADGLTTAATASQIKTASEQWGRDHGAVVEFPGLCYLVFWQFSASRPAGFVS